MRIGCNLSDQLIELIQNKEVNVDCVKIMLKDLYDIVPIIYKQYGTLLLHGIGKGVPQHTGARFVEEAVDWNQINRQLMCCESPHLALHCASYWRDWESYNVTYDYIKERMNRFISVWKTHVSVDILIENVPYTKNYEINNPGIIKVCVNPKLIKELCYENDIGLCLDVAHARVTAFGLKIPLKDYLEQLPLKQVREIHVVGIRMVDGDMRDNHMEMDEDDYETLEWLLQRVDADYLTLEYGGFGEHYSWRSDKEAIRRQLYRIQKIVKSNHSIV